MSWVKVDDAFPDHPKAVGLSLAATGLWLCCLCYANRHLTDGLIPRGVVSRLGGDAALAAAQDLVDAGLWIADGAGWRIHDYLAYQRSRDQVERAAAASRSNGRRGGRPKPDDNLDHSPTGNLDGTWIDPERDPTSEPVSVSVSGSGCVNGGESVRAGEGFAAFYAVYPRKQGRAKAEQAFARAAIRAGPEAIMAGLERQIPWLRQQHAHGYCPFPATWLNQDRWADEPPPLAAPAGAGPGTLDDRDKWANLPEGAF